MANTLSRQYNTCRYRTYLKSGTAAWTYRTYTQVSKLKSDQTKGQFISVHGNQFRKATFLTKSTFTITPTAPQYTEYKKLVSGVLTPAVMESGPGGGRLDYIADNMTINSGSGVGIKCLASQITHVSSMQNEAVTKALVKIADQKVNLGENLATLGMTLELLGKPVKSLVDLLKDFKRDKDLKRWAWTSYYDVRQMAREGKLPQFVANRYLEYVYGWKPLVNDIYTLVEKAKKISEDPLILNARGSSTRQYDIRPQVFGASSPNSTTEILSGVDLITTRCSIWAKVLPEHAGLRSLNQLGLVNPFSLAWELLPWSFVVDWVVPIGPVFEALTAPAGLQFLDGSISSRQRVSASYSQVMTGGVTNVTSDSPAMGVLTKDSYTRTVLGSWPAPGFWVDLDPFRGDRPMKAYALMLSNLKGIRNIA